MNLVKCMKELCKDILKSINIIIGNNNNYSKYSDEL